MTLGNHRNHLAIACVCALAAWMPAASAQLHGRQETRSGVLEFEGNGYPTDATVDRVREEIDYQRAVQAYIHFLPVVATTQWRNAHLGPLGGKPGDLIIYRTTEQKLPILTANDTTTDVSTFLELSDYDGLLIYEVPPGPTAGGVIDVWQRPVSDTGNVGPDRGRGGKFLIVLEGTKVPENHGADFVVTSKTSTVLIGTRILTPDPKEGQRILNAHKIYGLGTVGRLCSHANHTQAGVAAVHMRVDQHVRSGRSRPGTIGHKQPLLLQTDSGLSRRDCR